MQSRLINKLIKIKPNGRIAIPKKYRQLIGIHDNGMIRMKAEKGRIIIEPIRRFPYPVKFYSDNDVDEFFALDDSESSILREKYLL